MCVGCWGAVCGMSGGCRRLQVGLWGWAEGSVGVCGTGFGWVGLEMGLYWGRAG